MKRLWGFAKTRDREQFSSPEECLADFSGAGTLGKDRRQPRPVLYVVAKAPV
ncbi:MAG: hypothetical protein N2653_06950 [Burkholderiales bacterium]|nr:hypothetical protein [Burkholderiales bacterium]